MATVGDLPDKEAGTQNRGAELYRRELVETRASYEYIDLYRTTLRRWNTRLDAVRIIATSGGLASWAIFQSYPWIWAGIIGAAQLADIANKIVPIGSQYDAATDFLHELDKIIIQALADWERVQRGQLDIEDIDDLRRKLMESRSAAEKRCFSKFGLPEKAHLKHLAEERAKAYFERKLGGIT